MARSTLDLVDPRIAKALSHPMRARILMILNERVYASLRDIPDKVDMVDIFRASSAAPAIVEEAIAIGARVVWMQLGVRHDAAARRAEEAGLTVIMNRCPKIEYGRLNRELSWGGVNSRIISSKRRLEARR